MTDPIYPLELIAAAVSSLAGVPNDRFQSLVQEVIRAAGGLVSKEAATFLAAQQLGVDVSSHYTKFDEKAWVYNFVATKSDSKRMNQK